MEKVSGGPANRARRRWFVLTKGHLFSYKEMKIYSKPTEAIEMSKCRTVKSIEEEINRPHAFVRSRAASHDIFRN